MKRLALLAALASLVACGRKTDTTAPWVTTLDLATHSALYFPVNVGDLHGPRAPQTTLTTCNECHADRSTGADPPPAAASFKTFTCTGCHVQVGGVDHAGIAALATLPDHVGKPEFDPLNALSFDSLHVLSFDRACRGCHPTGQGAAPPSYHGLLFPIDPASKHAGIACSKCHGTTRSDLVGMKCASCHADPTQSQSFPTQHAPVGGVSILVELTEPMASTTCVPAALPPLQSPDCLTCHAVSNPVLVSAHPTDRDTFGTDPHRSAGCLTCHVVPTQVTAAVTPPATPPAGYPTIDFLTFISPVTGVPVSPAQTAKGCATCHSHGCGGN